MIQFQFFHQVLINIRVIELVVKLLQNPDDFLISKAVGSLDLDYLGDLLSTQMAEVLCTVHLKSAEKADFRVAAVHNYSITFPL